MREKRAGTEQRNLATLEEHNDDKSVVEFLPMGVDLGKAAGIRSGCSLVLNHGQDRSSQAKGANPNDEASDTGLAFGANQVGLER